MFYIVSKQASKMSSLNKDSNFSSQIGISPSKMKKNVTPWDVQGILASYYCNLFNSGKRPNSFYYKLEKEQIIRW
jgi:hypothetical protein